MISIIVSSYKPETFQKFSDNVKETISVPYELIKIDNPGLYSITEAYNKGANKAKFDILCFSHEDVIFRMQNWGLVIVEIFKNIKNAGVLGVAGSRIKLKQPTGWMCGLGPDYDYLDADVHTFNHRKVSVDNFNEIQLHKCKVLDGLILFCKKQTWEIFKFNEKLDGFHFYDIDFSLRVSKSLQNYAYPDFYIYHASKGSFNNEWVDKSIQFHKMAIKENYPFDKCTYEELFLVRNFWYNFLEKSDLSFIQRLNYVLNIGVWKHSLKPMLSFLKLIKYP